MLIIIIDSLAKNVHIYHNNSPSCHWPMFLLQKNLFDNCRIHTLAYPHNQNHDHNRLHQQSKGHALCNNPKCYNFHHHRELKFRMIAYNSIKKYARGYYSRQLHTYLTYQVM